MQKHGYQVFDAHHHLAISNLDRPQEELDQEIASDYQMRLPMMDRHGIRGAALHPPASTAGPRGQEDVKAMNNLMARYKQKYADRFPLVLGTVEPWRQVGLGVEELERCIGELKLDGFSWHNAHTHSEISSPSMVAFFRKVTELKVPTFVHVADGHEEEDPFGVEVLAEEFPEVIIVALDALSSTLRAKRMIRIAQHYRNVYLEIGVTRSIVRLIDMAVKEVGGDRVMFGSDLIAIGGKTLHYNFPHPLYEVIDSPHITEEEKRLVLWGTAERLFGLKQPGA